LKGLLIKCCGFKNVNIAVTVHGIVYTSRLVVAMYWKVFANLNTCGGKLLEKSLNVKLP